MLLNNPSVYLHPVISQQVFCFRSVCKKWISGAYYADTVIALNINNNIYDKPPHRSHNVVNVVHKKYLRQSGVFILLGFSIQIILESRHNPGSYRSQLFLWIALVKFLKKLLQCGLVAAKREITTGRKGTNMSIVHSHVQRKLIKMKYKYIVWDMNR